MIASDARIDAVTPAAAAVVCAVGDHDRDAIAASLLDLDRQGLYALVVLLAANVDEDSDLARYAQPTSSGAIIATVLEEACSAFGVTRDEVLSASRRIEATEARQVAMAACRLAGLSSPAVGEAFGRDHSTVLYAATRCGESQRLRRITRLIAAPLRPRTGVLGDELTAAS